MCSSKQRGSASTQEESQQLIRAAMLYRRLQALLRLSLDDQLNPSKATKGLEEALVHVVSLDPELSRPGLDISALGATLAAVQTTVAGLFDRYCPPETPATSLGDVS